MSPTTPAGPATPATPSTPATPATPATRLTPVIVGVGACQQRLDDPTKALEPIDLMVAAVLRAAIDADAPELLRRLGAVYVPRGTWSYPDPGTLLIERLGAAGLPTPPQRPRSVVAELGVLQQTLLTRAYEAVANSEVEAVLVVGGEAKWRALSAARAGTPALAVESAQPGALPDETWQPAGEILSRLEIARGLAVPARQYAVMESALRARLGQGIAEHRDELAVLWSSYSETAADNPDAWTGTPIGPAVLSQPSPTNPMLATPYTKLHCSQWNVDQAAALLVTSSELAGRLHIAEDRLVHPIGAAESNAMIHLPARAELAACPAIAIMAERLADATDVDPADAEDIDLYSCFPSAVRIQAVELGLPVSSDLTVTGGMTFAGGPLNNYALQAAVALVQRCRAEPDSIAMMTSVSGLLTKQSLSFLSASPPAHDFVALEVGPAAIAGTETFEVVADHAGRGVVAGFTVAHDHGEPIQAIAVVTTEDGRRTVATSEDGDLVASMAAGEWVGRQVTVAGEKLAG